MRSHVFILLSWKQASAVDLTFAFNQQGGIGTTTIYTNKTENNSLLWHIYIVLKTTFLYHNCHCRVNITIIYFWYWFCVKLIVYMKSLGVIPQIDFQNVQPNNVVYPSNFLPFNLTAIVVSNSNLTSLHWSPPEASNRPVPNRTITDHHGNLTTTTLMLLEYDPSGKYTLTAVNECGENSSQVDMATYFGIPSVYIDPTFTAMFVVFVVFVVFIILATITIVVPVTLVRFCYRKCTAPVEDELHGEGKHMHSLLFNSVSSVV